MHQRHVFDQAASPGEATRRETRLGWVGAMAVGLLLLGAAGCSGDDGTESGVDAGGDAGLPPLEFSADCDPIHDGRCAMPWPSSLYLEEDGSRATGLTLAFGDESLPRNNTGSPVDPEPWQRLDGYGVGTPAMVAFENLDASGLPGEREVERSLAEDASILWYRVEEDGGLSRVPYWTELDWRAPEDAERKTLIIRPAVILQEGTRYIIAMRNLRRNNGEAVEPTEAFRRLRAGQTSRDSALAKRQAQFEDMFGRLASEGVERDSLQLAWDFTTASSEALHGTMLEMREKAFAAVGENGANFTIESVTEQPEDSDDEGIDEDVKFTVEGTFEYPRYMRDATIRGSAGPVFNRNDDGELEQNGTAEAPFWMMIPRSAIQGEPAELVLYGHGLLGRGSQTINDYNARPANEHNYIYVGTDMLGMASGDSASAIAAVGDMSKFPFMADRLHQGLLNHLLLGRGMQERLQGKVDAHETLGSEGITVEDETLHYTGISQGGIFGASVVALSRDVTRGVLGVPGNNYTTLLERSTGFESFGTLMLQNYPDRRDRLIGISLMGQLWEQTEPVSYLRHLEEAPFDGNDPSRVLLISAKGDHQVANVTNEVATRSDIGIGLMEGYGRTVDGVEPAAYPRDGSGVVNYDFGNPWPPTGNVTPTLENEDAMEDPHGKPREQANRNRQMDEFFQTGQIIDVCSGDGDPRCTPE